MSCGYCAPSCTIPTCSIPSCSPSPVCYPVGGLGSLCGGYGSSSGLSYGGLSGGAVSAGSLGILGGASVGCVTQTPPSEIVIQRPSVCVTLPGAILSASCEPIGVGGYTACGGGSSGGSSSIYSSGAISGRLGISGSRLSCSPRVCYSPY